jgi:hypothetical protein
VLIILYVKVLRGSKTVSSFIIVINAELKNEPWYACINVELDKKGLTTNKDIVRRTF